MYVFSLLLGEEGVLPVSCANQVLVHTYYVGAFWHGLVLAPS